MTIDVREYHERQTMRAFGFRRYGPPEVLEPLEVPRPEPGTGEVLTRVAAAGVNPADWALRGGRLRPFVRLKLPFVSGSDVAGVVAETGAEVTNFVPGEAVYAMAGRLAVPKGRKPLSELVHEECYGRRRASAEGTDVDGARRS